MKRRTYTSNIIMLVCVLLILSFFVEVILPHPHTCQDAHCALCSFSDTLKKLMGTALLLCAFGYIRDMLLSISVPFNSQKSSIASTPVKLKVKLSN